MLKQQSHSPSLCTLQMMTSSSSQTAQPLVSNLPGVSSPVYQHSDWFLLPTWSPQSLYGDKRVNSWKRKARGAEPTSSVSSFGPIKTQMCVLSQLIYYCQHDGESTIFDDPNFHFSLNQRLLQLPTQHYLIYCTIRLLIHNMPIP